MKDDKNLSCFQMNFYGPCEITSKLWPNLELPKLTNLVFLPYPCLGLPLLTQVSLLPLLSNTSNNLVDIIF